MTVSAPTDRRLTVARQIVTAQRGFPLFLFDGEQHPSRAILQTMRQAECAFAADDFDRAEHLAKVVTAMIKREAPKFAADPKKYIERQGAAS